MRSFEQGYLLEQPVSQQLLMTVRHWANSRAARACINVSPPRFWRSSSGLHDPKDLITDPLIGYEVPM